MATFTSDLRKTDAPSAFIAAKGSSLYVQWGKRLFDISASLAGLVITSPLLALGALLVRLTSPGPVLFRQVRIGYYGRRFTLIKFRTMVQGAEKLGSSVVVGSDSRLTPVGNFLRRTKLDELPQFINVLRGEMSFVGPRPRVPSEVEMEDPHERTLMSVRPGITSYASIHHRMEADYCARQPNPQAAYRSDLLPQKRSLDCEYVQNLTFGLDLELLLLTFMLVCLPGKSLTKGVRLWGWEVRPYGRGGQMLLELSVYAWAGWLAYSFRYEAGFPVFYRHQMWYFLAIIPFLRVVVNHFLKVYDMMWRYVTIDDIAYLAAALAPITLTLYALRLGLPTGSWLATMLHVPLSVITLEYTLALGCGVGLRGLRRVLYMMHHHYQPLPEGARRVMILGAGLLGLTTAQDIRPFPHINLVGFVDDDPSKEGRIMAGCRVLGNTDNLEALCARHKITDLVVCAKSLPPQTLLDLFRRCEILRVKLHKLPRLDQVLRGESELPPTARLATSLAGGRIESPE